MNSVQQPAPSVFPAKKKAQEVIRSYAQNETEVDHLQRISWLLVAILNATLIALWRYTGQRKKEDEQF